MAENRVVGSEDTEAGAVGIAAEAEPDRNGDKVAGRDCAEREEHGMTTCDIVDAVLEDRSHFCGRNALACSVLLAILSLHQLLLLLNTMLCPCFSPARAAVPIAQ